VPWPVWFSLTGIGEPVVLLTQVETEVSVVQAIVLGLVQGLSEFLPVSSSGHLLLVRYLLKWPDPGLAFDVSLHLGTLVAVLWYFWRDWMGLIRASLRVVVQREARTPEERRALFLILATLPAVTAAVLFADLADTLFRAPQITAVALILLGVVLWYVDRTAPRDRGLDSMRWGDALMVGLAQMLALVPGVSRSGATMTAGRALGFDRGAAARFSFLMSMPIIAAAALRKVPEVIAVGNFGLPLLLGILSAMISGWLAIAALMQFVSKRSYGVFAIYRVVLGIIVLWTVYTRGG
jgi:undecaprenyl-diphosphatase